jgi:hypothetical protein
MYTKTFLTARPVLGETSWPLRSRRSCDARFIL